MKSSRYLILPALIATIASCATSPPEPVPEIIPEGVGEVELRQAIDTPADEYLLDIGIVVFDSAPARDNDNRFGDWVFDEVRDNERHLLPYSLRESLQAANQWGAVRVLPEPDPSVHLTVTGTILRSDGQELELQIEAVDATGRVWLERDYYDRTADESYLPPRSLRRASSETLEELGEPFEDLYEQIANDLLEARNALGAQELNTISDVALLVYANDLSPDSFGHMLSTDPAGRTTVTALPAQDDPMLRRVMDMRRRHHLFIDTVDEYYEALHEQTESPYLIWRSYSFEQIQEEARAAQRGSDQSRYSSTTGYLTLTQRYDRYRWSKIYQQEYQELAAGFNRETAPAILELNRQVHGLSGSLEEQYTQWRRILRELFELESGAN